ncbi:MAG: CGGC domain-containing protein [Phascolarctobacterium faecium]
MPMKKIAVLRCLRTSNNCTGSGCLKAFNNKTNAFAVYEAEETELAAFLNCSGCCDVQMPNNEEGLRKKLDRLVTIGVEAVHLSGCTKKKDAQGENMNAR